MSDLIFPVENLLKGLSGLEMCLDRLNFLHASLSKFLACSELTAFSSLAEDDSDINGAMKNWAKRSRAPSNALLVTSKW